MLSLQAQRNIVATHGVAGTVTANLYNVTLAQALDAILAGNGLVYRERGNFIYVYTPAELAALDRAARPMAPPAVFRLAYVAVARRAADGQAAAQPRRVGDGHPRLGQGHRHERGQRRHAAAGAGDTGGNSYAGRDLLVVTDYAENLARIRRLIKRGRPPAPAGAGRGDHHGRHAHRPELARHRPVVPGRGRLQQPAGQRRVAGRPAEQLGRQRHGRRRHVRPTARSSPRATPASPAAAGGCRWACCTRTSGSSSAPWSRSATRPSWPTPRCWRWTSSRPRSTSAAASATRRPPSPRRPARRRSSSSRPAPSSASARTSATTATSAWRSTPRTPPAA